MITCTPKGFFSPDFIVSGPDFEGKVTFSFWNKSGWVSIGRTHYEVRGHGLFRRTYSLLAAGMVIATAESAGLFSSKKIIRTEDGTLTLQRASFFSSASRLNGTHYNCELRREGFFSRTITISGRWKRPEIVLFAFWIKVHMRREEESSSAGGSD